jgi:predicted O-methyltransferase YrrM
MLKITDDEHGGRIAQLQKLFNDLFADLRRNGGKGPVAFEPAPALSAEHVSGARVFPNRHAMIEALAPKQGVCAEVGVLKGNFSANILRTTSPRELHLLDLDFSTYGVAERFRSEVDRRQVKLVQGDSSTNLGRYAPGFFDWIYVDGDHSYAGCWKDLEAGVRVVKPDGYVFANDYVLWSHTECRPYGVVHAVNRLCVDHGWRIVGFALHPSMFCDVALQRRPARTE